MTIEFQCPTVIISKLDFNINCLNTKDDLRDFNAIIIMTVLIQQSVGENNQ